MKSERIKQVSQSIPRTDVSNEKSQSEILPAIPEGKGEWDQEAIERRKFLEATFFTLTGLATVGVAGVAGRFLAGTALEKREAKWVEAGKIAELPTGAMHRLNFSMSVRDAWRKEEQKGTVYVYRPDETTIIALDATCTHLGCVVRWKEEEKHFACPCHSGYFRQDGSVESGPPPAALRTLANKIEDGVLWIEV